MPPFCYQHAELVSRRVVVLVVSMLLVIPATDYSTMQYSEQTPINMLGSLYDPVLHPFNSATLNKTVLAFLKNRELMEMDLGITMLAVGRVVYSEKAPLYSANEKLPPMTELPDGITMRVDATLAKSNEAILSIFMTSFIVVVFIVGSSVFSKDAKELALGPIERIANIAKSMAGTLFAMDDTTVLGMESAYIEAVMAKIRRFFEVNMLSSVAHKRTTVFTENKDVWHIDVRREEEKERRGKVRPMPASPATTDCVSFDRGRRIELPLWT